MRGLELKTILAVGGAGTIGTSTCERLAREGAAVVVTDRDIGAARDLASRISRTGGRAAALAIDVTDEESVVAAIEAAQECFGTIDGAYINVADLAPDVLAADRDVVDLDLAVFDHVMAVNLRGHVVCTKHIVPRLVARGGGPIVYASSAGAYLAAPTRVAYAVSKSGLNALVRHVAAAYGKVGIRANAVAPGLVLDESNGRARDPEVMAGLLARTLSGRLGQPSDVASMVAMLLSDDAEWLTGQIISVDGGFTVRA